MHGWRCSRFCAYHASRERELLNAVRDQLEMFGLEGARSRARAASSSPRERTRLIRRVETTHEILSALPAGGELSFLHSGLCQTCLPHSRPANSSTPWERRSGRFSLTVLPGGLDRGRGFEYVGIPYGPKARLILIYLQTEGIKSRTVNLGASFSAFLRSLGLAVTGGQRGTISAVREQSLRISQCRFTMQWNSTDATQKVIANTQIVDRLELWRAGKDEWLEHVELSERFHEHLREHAVPLDRRGIAHLSGSSLGLDLYTLLAYRLPRLDRDLHLRWSTLQEQLGTAERTTNTLAARMREVMPDVLTAYPHAKVELTPHGLLLKPSLPAVPKATGRGFSLIET
jgi:Plasmid encoded RepA protein